VYRSQQFTHNLCQIVSRLWTRNLPFEKHGIIFAASISVQQARAFKVDKRAAPFLCNLGNLLNLCLLCRP
jgi:hypothetical protein